jgi:hypothetical protein
MSCDPCAYFYLASNQSCHQVCPDFTYQNSGECASCLPPCRLCSGAEACLSCEKGLLLRQQCLGVCPPRYYASVGECKSCSLYCESCNKQGCLACAIGYFLEAGLCVDTCSKCTVKVAARGFKTAYRDKEIVFSWDWYTDSKPVFYCNSSNFELLSKIRQITVRWSCNESSHIYANIRFRVAAGRRDAEYTGLYEIFCLSNKRALAL